MSEDLTIAVVLCGEVTIRTRLWKRMKILSGKRRE